jgi:hypothetical protein
MEILILLRLETNVQKIETIKITSQDHYSFLLLSSNRNYHELLGLDHDLKRRMEQLHKDFLGRMETKLSERFGTVTIGHEHEWKATTYSSFDLVVIEREHEYAQKLLGTSIPALFI